jgi:predicted Zn-dependent protease
MIMEKLNPMTRRSLLRLAAGLPLAAAAPLAAEEPNVTVPPYNTLSDADEVAIGRRFAAEMEKELKMLEVGPLTSYVNDVVGELGRRSRRPNLKYVAKIIDSPVVNAVSLPGGYMFVYRGLLHKAANESELVGVLGHEVGHIVARHSANKIMLDYRARILYDAVKKNLDLDKAVLATIEKFGGPLVLLALLKFSRENEYEADMLGFYNMVRSGWHPNGMVNFFIKLKEMRSGEPTIMEDLMSTHPDPGARAIRVKEEFPKVRIDSSLTEDSLKFKAMKLGLSLLPPPPAPAKGRK